VRSCSPGWAELDEDGIVMTAAMRPARWLPASRFDRMRLSSNQGAHMRLLSSSVHRRRGITVLGLAILIIVIVVLVIFLVRYLGQHPTTTSFLNRPVALMATAASV
jgi:hypothetical protein